MKAINLEQGSPEWHEFRRNHLGASDCAIILGLSPWRTPSDLWCEKVLGWEQPTNERMREGSRMEEEARTAFMLEFGIVVKPIVAEDDEFSFISASFDGIADDYQTAVEIKCGKIAHIQAEMGIVPDYYLAQLQQQIYVGKLQEINYYAYSKKIPYNIVVKRDDEFIKEMLDKLKKFWYHIQTKTPLGSDYDTVATF